jgi:hypothetical protein
MAAASPATPAVVNHPPSVTRVEELAFDASHVGGPFTRTKGGTPEGDALRKSIADAKMASVELANSPTGTRSVPSDGALYILPLVRIAVKGPIHGLYGDAGSHVTIYGSLADMPLIRGSMHTLGDVTLDVCR